MGALREIKINDILDIELIDGWQKNLSVLLGLFFVVSAKVLDEEEKVLMRPTQSFEVINRFGETI